jgi:hypothetical protein
MSFILCFAFAVNALLKAQTETSALREQNAALQAQLASPASADTRLLNDFENFGCAIGFYPKETEKENRGWQYSCDGNVVKGFQSARGAMRALIAIEKERKS